MVVRATLVDAFMIYVASPLPCDWDPSRLDTEAGALSLGLSNAPWFVGGAPEWMPITG